MPLTEIRRPVVVESEEPRLLDIQAAALRVASSRRNGVVLDQGALDRLDAALEGQLRHACMLALSAEQLAYVLRLITNDIADASALIHSRSFSQYGPVESELIHSNVRIGATLLGQLPPLSQSTKE